MKSAFLLASDAEQYSAQLLSIFTTLQDGKLTEANYAIHKNGMPYEEVPENYIPTIGIPVEITSLFDQIDKADKSDVDTKRLKETMNNAVTNLQKIVDMPEDDPAWGKSPRGMTQESIGYIMPTLTRILGNVPS